MQFEAKIKRFADPPAKRLIVRTGKDAVSRKVSVFSHAAILWWPPGGATLWSASR